MRASFFSIPLSLLTACSTSHGDVVVTDLGRDATSDEGLTLPDLGDADMPISFHCVSDATCDDHLFCTGNERCQPGNPLADSFGCVRGLPPCEAGFDCSEVTHGCTVIADGGMDSGFAGDSGVRATVDYYDYDTLSFMRLPAPSTASGGAPDTSCFGTPGAPSPTGTAASVSVMVEDFQYLSPTPSVPVDVFTDDHLPPTLVCGAGCTATTVSAAGDLTFTAVPGSWISYASHAHTGVDMAHTYVPTLSAHRAATSGSVEYVASQQTLALIPTLLGLRRVAGTSVVLGSVGDCAGAPVGGLVIRVFRADGSLVSEPRPPGGPGSATMPGYRYFGDTDLPSSSQYYTNPLNGLYAAINVPPATPLRVEAWEDDGTVARLWACEEILTTPDAVSILGLAPYRSDGPTTCTEARP